MNAKTRSHSLTITCIRFSCCLCRESSIRRRFGDRLCEVELHNGDLINAPHSALPVVQADMRYFESTVALVAVLRVVFPTTCAEKANPEPRACVNCHVIVSVLPFCGTSSLESKVVVILALLATVVHWRGVPNVPCGGRRVARRGS